MPEFPISNGDLPEPGRDLPAPYVDPWTLLGRDLRALLASLGLKARELWRRNLAADLPRPRFWPRQAAPLFWPLVLVGLLVPLLALGRLVRFPAATPGSEGSAAPEAIAVETGNSDRAQGSQTDKAPQQTPSPGLPDPSPPGQPLTGPGVLTEPLPQLPETPAPELTPESAPEPSPELAALAPDDPDHLIAATRTDPADGLLVLTLTPTFGPLNEAQRRRWAERWREAAENLGYEELELRSPAGRLLGRNARVGSGMILLEPERTR